MPIIVDDRLRADLLDVEARALGTERSGANGDASDPIGAGVQWSEL
jgi:hypothetical protein